MSLPVFSYLIAAGLFMAGPLLAENVPVELTDLQGRKLTARLISSDGVNVMVSRDAAVPPVVIQLKNLSEDSRKVVSEWVEKGGNLRESYDITVETGKTRKKDGSEDFDDKRVNLSPTVIIKNLDPNFPTRDGKVTVLFLGRPVDSSTDLFVFRKQQYELPKLDPLASKAYMVEAISQSYDSRGLAKFGSRYLGYVVLVHDEAGEKIIFTKSVPAAVGDNYGKKLLSLKADKAYDKDLKERIIYMR